MPTFPASDRERHQSKVEKALASYVSDRCAGVAKALRSRTAAATDDWWDESEAEAEATDALSGPVRDASLAAAGHITRNLVKGGFDPNADFDSAVDDRVGGAGAAYAAVVRDDLQRRIDDAEDDSLAAEAVDTYGAETQRPGVVAAYETAWAVAFGSTAGGTAAQEDDKADGRTVTRTWVLSPDHGDPDECDDNEGASFAADEEADVEIPAHYSCACEWEIDWADAVTASGRIVPLVADAIPAHQTDTEDVPFDAAEMTRNLAIGDGEAEYRQAHAWQDPEGNPDAKGSYRWLHHRVSPKGLVGAANMGACLSGVNSLNRGASIPDGDREGTYEHMASHLRDGSKDVPDLAEPVTASGHVWDACSPEVMARFAAANPEAITAAAADGSPGGVGGSWHGVLAMEGLRTTDGREIAPGALMSRMLPLPFAYLVETTSGHQEARLSGRIDAVERDTSGRIIGQGVFDTGVDGAECERLVAAEMLRGVSIDPEVIEWELVLDGGGTVDIMDLFFGDVDPNTVTERWTLANLMGATGCMWPAFSGAMISMADKPLPSASDPGPHEAHPIPLVVAASAALGSMWWESDDRPPAEWFDHPDDPNHDGFVLTDEGRLYGYVAPEGLRHVGITDRRVTVPVCEDYDRFCVGVVKAMAAEGVVRPVRTGPIVMGTGHADKRADWREATRHYDNTGAAVADITVGNDEHGVWFAGCVRPTITAEQLYVLNATRRVSGDWRPIEQAGQPTQLEMVGVLAVNAGGFPQRASVVASLVQQWAPDTGATSVGFRGEEVTSLVACMPPPGQSSAMAALRARVEALESAVRPLRPLALERIAAKMLR